MSDALPLGRLAVGLALLAGAGALAAAGVLPPAVGTLAGAVLIPLGAALGPLARWSPREPSLLKLVVLSALFSPALCGAAYVLLHLFLPADAAVAGAFGAAGLGALCALGRSVERPRLARAGRAAIALGVACALVSAFWLLRGSAARASYHGLLHSALVLAADRGVPPGNPFLAGEPLAYYWWWHANVALVARALALAPTTALALSNVWAAAVLPATLYLLAGPLSSEGRRELVGVVLALFGLNALGGWLWLRAGFPWHPPGSSLGLLDTLRPTLLQVGGRGVDPRLAFGFSKLGNPSSYPFALALLVGSWTAAAHALRRAVRPWVGATALLSGASFLANPLVGAVAILVVGVAALLHAPGTRLRVLGPLVLAALPGAWLALDAGSGYSGSALAFAFSPERCVATLAPVALLLLPLPWALVGGGEDRSRVVGLLLVGSLVPLALAAVVVLPYDNQYKLVRIAAVPLGLLAGRGLVELWDRAGAARLAGAALFVLLGGGALLDNALGFAAYGARSGDDVPIVEGPLSLGPDPAADGEGLAPAYAFVAELARELRPAPVLVVDVLSEDPARYAGHAFTDPRRNLQGHEAAAFAAVDLWCDRPSQALDKAAAGLRERLEVALRLFREAGELPPADRDRMLALGRPVLVLVRGGAGGYNPGPADPSAKLARAGFATLYDAGGVAVLGWPADLAARPARADPDR